MTLSSASFPSAPSLVAIRGAARTRLFSLILKRSFGHRLHSNSSDTLRSPKSGTLNLSPGSSPPLSRVTSPLNHEMDNRVR